MRKPVCTILLALALAPPALAQQADVAGQFAQLDEANRVFAMTCLAHVFSHVDLAQKFGSEADAFRYSAAQAAAFLAGHGGTVWGLRGQASNYAVVLQDGGICSLNVQSSVAGVWDDFEPMLRLFFPDMELVPANEALAGPATATARRKAYRLRIASGLLPPVFSLTVSTDPKLQSAARLTLYFPPSAPQP